VVPAAGLGKRFGAKIAKQYSNLLGKTLMEHCLERLLNMPCESIIVALHNRDNNWQDLDLFNNSRISCIGGGDDRTQSVRNALTSIEGRAGEKDWVLVHDVVRPCITQNDLVNLIAMLEDSPVGGLLATPVNATLKRILPSTNQSDNPLIVGVVDETVEREALWQAATPQMFRYGLLSAALKHCAERNISITDEAQAVEIFGYQPQVIRGRSDNIKVTNAEDLVLAEAILRSQKPPSDGQESGG
jgi:2-C-methyl-D-erythritol 4-phosphate cytidylyltransferase